MLKHFLLVSIALFATAVAISIFWVVFMPWLHFPVANDQWPKLILALLELATAIYVFLRWRTWPARLLLVGSIPVLLVNISFVGWNWRMDRYYSKSPPADDPLLAMLFPSDNEPSPINAILYYLVWISAACLSVAFFCWFLRAIDRRLIHR